MSAEEESGMELRDLLEDTEFRLRRASTRPSRRSSLAFNRIARVFADSPSILLQELVNLAVEYCGADSAGISVEEMEEDSEPHFRWVAITGTFSKYIDGTTPRFYSPCGTCLNSGRPQLYRVTKTYYDFLGITADPIRDGILIPWISGETRGTIWAVSHDSRESFDLEDYRILNNLACFVSVAIQHQAEETAASSRAAGLAADARSHEMAHQINNPLQSLTNTLFLAGKGGPDTEIYINQASKEVESLTRMVRELLSERIDLNPGGKRR